MAYRECKSSIFARSVAAFGHHTSLFLLFVVKVNFIIFLKLVIYLGIRNLLMHAVRGNRRKSYNMYIPFYIDFINI